MMKWLSKKQRNRRVGEREHLLNIKLRTSQARAARVRLIGIFAGVFVALFALWRGGQLLLDVLIYKNDAFALQTVEVQTDGVLTDDVIRHWAMLHGSRNLMNLDLTRVQHDLEAQAPIQFAAVERVLPHTLRVNVRERMPIAQTLIGLPSAGGLMEQSVVQFDEEGFAMLPIDARWRKTPAPPAEKLPMLLEVPVNEVQLSAVTDNPQVRGALELITELDRSPMAGMADFKTINLGIPEILQVTTGQGSQVTFSLNHFDNQLRRWRLISDQYQKWGQIIASLDLSIDNNLPVRSAAYTGGPITPTAVPAPVSAPAKPSRTKRKHV